MTTTNDQQNEIGDTKKAPGKELETIITDKAPSNADKKNEKDSEETRFQFRPIEILDYPETPIRDQEIHRLHQILQSPLLNVPLLVVDRQEDVLPVLSLYAQRQQKIGNNTSFFSVTPSDFNMDYGDPDMPFDARDNIRTGASIIEYGDHNGGIPVYCDLSEYMNWNLIGEFSKNFLDTNKPAIILTKTNELEDVRQSVRDARNTCGGLENPEKPYQPKGLAKTVELKISPMTDDEKLVYFLHYLDCILLDNNLTCSLGIKRYLIQESLKRSSDKNIFFKTFEVINEVVSIAQGNNQNAVSKKIVTQALQEKLAIHNQTKALADMDSRLKKKIFGQDQAIDRCYETILAGLDDTHREKPTILAFFGPSGVGKTALAEEIALAMTGKKVSTINMAEYADSFKVSILTGSAKGYVDSDKDGLLAKIVKETPNAVILLDEFEKAHPQVQQVFLGIFDKGSVFDNHAGNINMSQTTIILTSNAGVHSEQTIGFSSKEQSNYVADEKEIQNSFPNELLGRMDAKIFFQPLSPKVLNKIIDKFMGTLKPRFDQLGIKVILSRKARQEIIRKASDPALGARPIMSFIRQKIKTPIEIAVLKKKIKKGSRILIRSIEDKRFKVLPQKQIIQRNFGDERIHS